MNEQFFDDREIHQSETFLIPTKTLLRYIEALPIKEGHDVDWETYDRLLGERVPWHGRWDIWTCFVFGMRYILPRVVSLNGKSMVVIHDLSPRRCLRASKEERKESNALYQAMMERSHRKLYSYPRSLLKCVSLPEGIEDPLNVKLMLGEDGIVVLEEVCHRKSFIFVATRLMRLGCRPLARARQPFIFSRSDVWGRLRHLFVNSYLRKFVARHQRLSIAKRFPREPVRNRQWYWCENKPTQKLILNPRSPLPLDKIKKIRSSPTTMSWSCAAAL